MGTSITRFSTLPESVTITTSARPGPSATNSIWRRGSSTLGATTSPAQCESWERMEPASSSTSE